MKKLFYGIITLFFILILMPNVNAISKSELKSFLTDKTLKFEVYGRNSIGWEYDISDAVSELMDKFTEEYEIIEVRNNNKYANVDIKFYDEEKGSYDNVNIRFKLKPYGIFLTKDNFNTSTLKEIELSANNTNYKYKKSKITIDAIDFYDEDKAKLKTKSNKVSFKEPGIYLGTVYFKEDDLPSIDVFFYVELQNKINEVLDNLTEINVDRTYHDDYTNIELAEYEIVNRLISSHEDEVYIYPYITSNSSYVNEEEGIVNIDFEFILNDKTYFVKKQNIKIIPHGIKLNVDYDTIVMDVNDEFQIDYESYSHINWISTDPSIASVDENGKITANKNGACYIIADYGFNNGFVAIPVSVKPENIEDYKAHLTEILNTYVGDNKTIEVPFVYGSLNYFTLYDYIYEKIQKDENDTNLTLYIDFDNDLKAAEINLDYFYDVEYNGEILPSISYCDNYSHEEDEYYGGYSCGTDAIEVSIVYADEKEGFDESLLEKAEILASKINKNIYSSYINGHIREILDLRNDYSAYQEFLIDNSPLKSLIKNEDGFNLDFNAYEYNELDVDTMISGLCYIEKDGIVYASASRECTVRQTIKLNTLDDSESGIKKSIKSTILEELENAKVSVSRVPGQTKIYDIIITEEDSEPYKLRTYVYVLNNKIKTSPTVTVKNAKDNSLLISWNSVKYAEKYILYRSTDNKSWTKVSTLTDLTYTDTNLVYGKKYYYKVKAQNTVNSKTSNVVNGKTIPNKVTNVRVVDIEGNSVTISYDKVDVSGYEIYKSTNNKTWTKAASINNSDTLEFNIQGLLVNKKYYFKVRAYKTVSKKKVYGSFSSNVIAKTAPDKPIVTLSIRSIDSMNLLVKPSSGATKYIVEKSVDGENYELLRELEEVENLILEEHEFGQTYYYRVKACNSGNKCSEWNVVSLMQTTQVPKFTLTTKSKKVIVNISSVEGANGYEIYRSNKSKGNYTLVKEFTSEDEMLKYTDTTIKGQTYYYKVRSYKVVSEEKIYSPFSKVSKITSK